jgi:serine/threonine protein kinase
MMTECLDEESILSFCRGGLAPEKRRSAERHIAECEECRVLVSAVMRSSLVDVSDMPSFSASDPAMAPTTPLHGGVGTDLTAPDVRSAVTAPVHAGDVIAGKYVVERILGAGGMGVVVAARHAQLDQRFALKFLLPAACEAPGAVARFLREGKAAARITNEHVARVVDTGTLENGSPYLVMEYLDGADLGAVSRERGPLPADEAVDYVLQACEAIVEAHQLGIVHRDLKPANLFLTQRKDGSPLVKVLDFGISKAEGGSQPQLTSTSMLMGSPRYMSPEQMISAKDVDARTDIWAIGVILHELIAAEPVWHADTVQGLCALITSAPAPPLRQLVPTVPAELEAVVLRCLEKAPNDRIANVADLALALEPLAPAASRTSIDRILGVAGQSRRPRAVSAPVPSAASFPPSSVATKSEGRAAGGGRAVMVLGGAIALLVVAGIALNTLVVRPRADLPAATAASPAPPTVPTTVASSIAAPAAVAVSSTPTSASPPVAANPSARVAPTPKAAAPRAKSLAPAPEMPPPQASPDRALSDRK